MSTRLSNSRIGLVIVALMIFMTIAAILYRAFGGHAPIDPNQPVPSPSLAPRK